VESEYPFSIGKTMNVCSILKVFSVKALAPMAIGGVYYAYSDMTHWIKKPIPAENRMAMKNMAAEKHKSSPRANFSIMVSGRPFSSLSNCQEMIFCWILVNPKKPNGHVIMATQKTEGVYT
jgi:hypothetical protein